MKRLLLAALLGLACTATHAAGHAGQSELSNASANLSGVVVGGSLLTLAAHMEPAESARKRLSV